MRKLKDHISSEEYEKLGADDKKFLSRTSLRLFTHPAKGLKLNKTVKPIRDEIFKNLSSNIINGKGRVIDNLDKIKFYFWDYFNRKKKFGIYNSFSSIDVELGDYKVNLKDFALLLNFINDGIKSQLLEISEIRKNFETKGEMNISSQGEVSMEFDEWNKKYNGFIKNRLYQYFTKFSSGDINPKDIIFYYLCRHKFNDLDLFDSFDINQKIRISGLDVSIGQYLAILDMLDINQTLELNKKI